MFLMPDPTGQIATVSTTGAIDAGNPFFQSLGTNGRSCGSCHLQGSAFGLSAEAAQAVFAATGGSDPLFAPVDGANCPSVTAGRRRGGAQPGAEPRAHPGRTGAPRRRRVHGHARCTTPTAAR